MTINKFTSLGNYKQLPQNLVRTLNHISTLHEFKIANIGVTILQNNFFLCNKITNIMMSKFNMLCSAVNVWFFVIEIVALSSQNIFVAPFCSCWRLANTLLSQIAWHAAEVATTYFASDVDSATVACFFELQVITPDPKVKTLPEMFHLSSNDPAQSLLVNPYNLKLEDLEYQMSYSIVPAT